MFVAINFSIKNMRDALVQLEALRLNGEKLAQKNGDCCIGALSELLDTELQMRLMCISM